MNEEVKKDILSVLENACIALRKNDARSLREISNHTLHNASIFQDGDSIGIAITMYSLSKVYERVDYKGYPTWDVFDTTVKKRILQARASLKEGNADGFRQSLADVNVIVEKLDRRLSSYIKEVIYRAHISKGSRFYEHGLSMGKTAELLGISSWELMEYVGKTGIPDSGYNITKAPSQRLKEARKLFGVSK